MSYNFTVIEKKWQRYWLDNKSFRAFDPKEAQLRGISKKAYILDMFPYPSGTGLHVGHPEGYTATDIFSRYLRMTGHNVLHPMGWDAFGLPAEQYAIKNNVHPAETTKKNIKKFREQIQSLGLSYDWDREVDTTDPDYYRWTQWIFLQLFNSYFDPAQKKALPISHLETALQNETYLVAPDGSLALNRALEGMAPISGEVRIERAWKELTPDERRDTLDSYRLAYTAEVPVNWCPGLGTVLSNEEVIDGKSEVGGFPVERRPLRQWMLRITAYADRLVEDLNLLEWPDSLKEMQRNWIGRSTGAEVDFAVQGSDDLLTVFTTRPDTLYGATFMVIAPEHPLVGKLTTEAQLPAVTAYRAAAASKSDRDRMMDTKKKSGVFTGGYAINPLNEQPIPIYIADYVLMGYGTGAIMAVPAHDERDFDFAKQFGLPIVQVVGPKNGSAPAELKSAFVDDGIAINSGIVNGLGTNDAKAKMIAHIEAEGFGRGTVKYKLRDWLFSRQRYWGEPFPIVLDSQGRPSAISDSELPLRLPEMTDFKPTGTPEPPLSKATDWVRVSEGYTRETNTMPQWAGSCWYYLRYIDPKNPDRFVDPDKEAYWMPVDLYVGGVEHAVLHLLYSRFWHKVLFDLGHVRSTEPFKRLVNQGLILGETEFHFFESGPGKAVSVSEIRDIAEEGTADGPKLFGYLKSTGEKLVATRVIEELVTKGPDGYVLRANPAVKVDARSFKMSKSRGNVVNPDDIVRDYGADAFRLYEMYMGPLEATKPWATRDIVGMSRFLSSVHRNLIGEIDEKGKETKAVVTAVPIADALDRQLHRAIKKVAEDIEGLRFNVAIAELIKLNNEATRLTEIPRQYAETFTLLLAPFAPHLAEELWHILGNTESLSHADWPKYDPAKLVDNTLELPVQVNGKLRGKVTVAADATQEHILTAAKAAEGVPAWLEGKAIKKELYVPKKLVNFVVA